MVAGEGPSAPWCALATHISTLSQLIQLLAMSPDLFLKFGSYLLISPGFLVLGTGIFLCEGG
jgi:hypothetical protein